VLMSFALIVAPLPHSGVSTGHQSRRPWWCPRTALIGMYVPSFAVVPKNVDEANPLPVSADAHHLAVGISKLPPILLHEMWP